MCRKDPALMRIEPSASHSVLPFAARADVVSTENELHDRLARAEPGAALIYHIGMLARDRDRLATTLTPEQRDELNALASRAWRLAASGWGNLLQRRIGEECFAYLLVVRKRPRRNTPSVMPLLLRDAA
jgi:hypothetical protein